jgi:hypothetical protein
MPENLKTERYEDRLSGKIGVVDYIANKAIWMLLPIVGFAGGLLLKTITKIPMLDQLGGTIGTVAGAYQLWGANKKQQLEIDQLTTDITALRAMESPNTYLQRENQQLREQIAFRDKHTVSASSHEGRVGSHMEVASER